MHYLATANISNNVVYKVIKQVSAVEKHGAPLCPLQVYDSIAPNNFQLDSVKCTLLLINNMENDI